MRANRSRDTGPELEVRKVLHALGYRYRVNFRVLPSLRRTVDIAFTRRRVVVLIDGCFWHGCPEHYVSPKANSTFWREKVARNRERDAETNRVLGAAGWKVLRFWEHEPVEAVVAEICSVVGVTSRAESLGGDARNIPGPA